jgi:hypothetical protein
MKLVEFQKMKEIENEEDMSELKPGDFFLYGRSVISQKQNKIPGQEISYYQVVNKKGTSVEYAPVFDSISKEEKQEEVKKTRR